MAVNPLRERRSRLAAWALLLGLSAIAWLVVARESGAAVGIVLERPLRHGVTLSRAVRVGLLRLGLAVPFVDTAPALHAGGM